MTMPDLLVLNRADVEHVLDMASCIEAIEEGLRARARGAQVSFPRQKNAAGCGGALLGVMSAVAEAPSPLWAVKVVHLAAGNRARGLESHQGVVVLSERETGRPVAMLDATSITGLRTAALSAVATRILAPRDPRRIAILGTGQQARCHASAMREVFPDAEIVIWGRSQEAASGLARHIGADHAPTIREAVGRAQVVCTVTASPEPILRWEWLVPGCHVNAVGATAPTARELPGDLVAAAEVFVDDRSQVEAECGEILLAMAEGLIGRDHIRADLADVLVGTAPGRSAEAGLTIFKSVGCAGDDLAAASRAFVAARAQGIGSPCPW